MTEPAVGQGPQRFVDPLCRLDCFVTADILVRCPRCSRQALLAATDPSSLWPSFRLVCSACSNVDQRTLAPSHAPRAGCSPEQAGLAEWSDIELWLQTPCSGPHILWALNEPHLDLLERYTTASLRERGQFMGTMSMVERLPTWMKSAKNRDEIRHAITRLRQSITAPGRPWSHPTSSRASRRAEN